MPSPLEQIDWDNLAGENVALAYKLVQGLYAERVNIANLRGNSSTIASNITDKYPFASNSPSFGKVDWPVTWGGAEGATMFRVPLNYVNETKLAAAIGTTGDTGNGFRILDMIWTEAEVFAEHGISDWPDMTIPVAANIKIWYDILTSFKRIVRMYATDTGIVGNSALGDATGILMSDGTEEHYGGAGEPPMSQLPTDWGALWAGPTTVAGGAFPSKSLVIEFEYFDTTETAEVRSFIQAYEIDNQDFVDSGFSGSPLSTEAYGSFNYDGDTPFDDWASAIYDQDEILQMNDPVITDLGGNVDSYSIPHDVPAQPPTTEDIDGDVISQMAIVEDWDGDGGFEYYTPDP